ncbi:MAG: SDR family oxidoreductase [Gammaproteobacteria bacterium]|nr:SDR family oxidoreductase [Gammaproteobacteria bacterium]NIV49668.1 SDR family oxidoreductase [Gammaproteobacteria bacterium]NIW57066.1 SDR family oxidoreductase [Gammaproteobacteria bacterium]
MRGLSDKVALVTGAGGGIGAAICERLAEEGCRLALFDRDAGAVQTVGERIQALGRPASMHVVDITDYAAVADTVAAIESGHGGVDILVNNAGFDRFANFLDTTPQQWESIIAVNLYGTLNMHHVVLPGMRDRGRGRVVNIASDAGRVGSSMEAVYSACKGGIIAFTKSVARELARTGIRLNVVCPGPTDTPLLAKFLEAGEDGAKVLKAMERAVPMKRIGRPEDLTGMVAFLASDDAEYITGQVISVSGGLTMHG